MKQPNQSQRAQQFRSLHANPPLVLPCAWDAGTARLLEAAGARSIATSSGAIAWSCGYADGESIPWSTMMRRLEEIAQAVSVPVSADIEHGFASDLEELRGNIERLIDAGIIGINIEDAHNGALVSTENMIGRIRAVREIADCRLPEFFINVRTDCFLLNGCGEETVKDAVNRAAAYSEAGADGFFCPGLVDQVQIETVAKSTDRPLNVMMDETLPDVQTLADLGVRRISLGTSLAETSLNAVRSAWSGIFPADDSRTGELDYPGINDIFRG